MTKEEKIATFNNEYEFINEDKMKELARLAISELPEYFFHVAASSTGKYHPAYALGEGGLVRHTKAAIRFAHHLLALEQNQAVFSPHQQDEIIIALMLHDGWKHGAEETAGKYTVFEHPQVSADWVAHNAEFAALVGKPTVQAISDAIRSHMGQWNTSKQSKVVLDKPQSEMQKFVHMCDYLASRKDIIVTFDDDKSAATEPPKLDTFKMPVGKYKGLTLMDILKENPGYIEWMKTKDDWRYPIPELLAKLK